MKIEVPQDVLDDLRERAEEMAEDLRAFFRPLRTPA
jgi:hypothetical protein